MLQISILDLSLPGDPVKIIQRISLRNENGGYVQKFLPYPFSMLSIHFEPPPYFSIDGINYIELPKVYFNIGYLSEKEVYMRFGKQVESIVILLNPVALYTMFNISPSAIKEKIFLPAREILKDRYTIIEKLFRKERGETEIIDALSALLTPAECPTDYKVILTKKALGLIYDSSGDLSLKIVAGLCCISLRTLERYFAAFIGITPERYCQMIRLQKVRAEMEHPACSTIKNYQSCSLFYDQSHLINSFRMNTGQTPGSFVKARKAGYYDMEGILYREM